MIASAYSPYNLSLFYLNATSFPHRAKKHPLLLLITKFMIFVLCFHALFNYNIEREVEIEEEEPELVVILSPIIKRSVKKEHA